MNAFPPEPQRNWWQCCMGVTADDLCIKTMCDLLLFHKTREIIFEELPCDPAIRPQQRRIRTEKLKSWQLSILDRMVELDLLAICPYWPIPMREDGRPVSTFKKDEIVDYKFIYQEEILQVIYDADPEQKKAHMINLGYLRPTLRISRFAHEYEDRLDWKLWFWSGLRQHLPAALLAALLAIIGFFVGRCVPDSQNTQQQQILPPTIVLPNFSQPVDLPEKP